MTSLTRRYLVTIGGRLLSAVLQAGMVAFLARSLGVESYGSFAIVASGCVFLLSIADLGMTAKALKMGSEHDRDRMVSTISIWRAIVAILLVISLAVLGTLLSPSDLPLWLLTAYYVSGEAAGDMAVAVYQGKLRPVTAIAILVARRIAALVPFVAGLGLLQAQFALMTAGTAGIVALLVVALGTGSRPTSLLGFVRGNVRLILATSGRNLANLDAFVVGATSGVQFAALYGAAARLGNPVNIAIATLVQVAIPELAALRTPAERMREFRRLRLPVYSFAAAVALSSLLSPWIIVLLFGADFAGAGPILAGVLVGAAVSAVTQLYMSWFLAGEVPAAVANSSIPIGLAGLTLLGIMSALVGVWGAAMAIVVWRMATFAVTVLAWRASTAEFRKPN